MRNTNKKGFTIVELVIVVAVIAILAAVLIPTFSGIIKKAQLSSDQQAVRNLNTALATSVDKPESLRELADILKEAGYNTKDGFNSLLSDYAIFWYNTDKYNVIVLATIADGTIYAPAEDEEMVAAFKADYAVNANIYNLKDLAAEVFVGDKHYATLAEAVATELAEKDEVTIDLYNDAYFAETVTVTSGKTLNLNLNGHTISSVFTKEEASALIDNKGTLVIDDKTGTGKITTAATNPDKQDVPGYASNTITNTGTLILENGIIENTSEGTCCCAVDNLGSGHFTMNGGTLISHNSYAIRQYNTTASKDNVVEINGGKIEHNNKTTVIWQQDGTNEGMGGTLSITGGYIDGTILLGWYGTSSDYNVTIENCTVDTIWIYENCSIPESNISISNVTYLNGGLKDDRK